MKTVDRAQGRWREILPQLGIETRFLRNKQGPCPGCGGKTRFRVDDLGGRGTWFCNHCGAGAGLRLVMECNAWDFKTAVCHIDQIIGSEPRQPPRPAPADDDWKRRFRKIQDIINGATDPTVVD